MRESTLEKYLVAEVKKRGGKCLKLVGYIGIPDRLILLPGGIVIFVELKTKKGKLSPLQVYWSKILIGLGFNYKLFNDLEKINELFHIVAKKDLHS